jgi:hypothetical protein
MTHSRDNFFPNFSQKIIDILIPVFIDFGRKWLENIAWFNITNNWTIFKGRVISL